MKYNKGVYGTLQLIGIFSKAAERFRIKICISEKQITKNARNHGNFKEENFGTTRKSYKFKAKNRIAICF